MEKETPECSYSLVVSAKDVSNYPSLHASLYYFTLQYKSSTR